MRSLSYDILLDGAHGGRCVAGELLRSVIASRKRANDLVFRAGEQLGIGD